MYAAEMQRSLYYHAAAQQRSPLGLGLGFQPGVPSLPPHMAGHPFGHLAAMAGIPSLSHASSMPGSYNMSSHSSSSNAPSSSLNLIQNRNHSAASPIGENAMKSRSTVPSPAHSSSNIPSISAALPKHYLAPHKYTDPKKQTPSTSIAPPAHESYMSTERHTNSSSNRNSSNHNSKSSNSHLNAEQLKNVPKSTADSSYGMRDRVHRTSASPYDVSASATDCEYSISLEKVKSNLVTNNESRSEPMELSVSSDAPQAKFNAEQISPRKPLHSSSNNNKLKTMHFTNDELTNNGCQERLNEVKDLSGRFSSYDATTQQQQQQQRQPAINKPASDDTEADVNQIQADIQRSIGQSPEYVALSKEPIVTNTNSTSLEHDSTISNSEQQQIANNKDSKLSKMDSGDVEPTNTNAHANQNKSCTEHETSGSIETDAAKSTAAKSPVSDMPNMQPDQLGDNRNTSPINSIATGKPSDIIESNRDSDIAKISSNTVDTDGDGTAVAVENVEQAKQTKS